MSTEDITVYLRAPTLERDRVIDEASSVTLVPKFNDVGRWTIDLPGSSKVADVIGAGYGVIVEQDGMGDPLLSGNVDTMLRKSDGKGGEVLTIGGPDDNFWLAARQALPCAPSGAVGTIYGASDYDYRSGVGETVMRAYVTFNAVTHNPVYGLTQDSDTASGATVSEKARFNGTLLLLLQQVGIHAGGLGFRVVQSGTDLVFKVYTPVHREGEVVFGYEYGNLDSYTYQTQAPTCNHVIVAGGGDLTARTFYEDENTASIAKWGRITAFVDQRQTTDTTQLKQAAAEALLKGAEKNSLSIVPIDSERIRYGLDYTVGDVGRVDLTENESIIDVITQATLTIKPGEGLISKPLVGTGASDPDVPDFFDQRKAIAARFSSLETSK